MTTHTPQPCVNSVMSLANNGGQTVVLLNSGSYGGVSNFLNDTWTWTGTDWTQKSPGNFDPAGPLPTRQDASMAYDGNNVVVFGGRGQSEVDGVLGDTWSWNGTVWTKLAPATSPAGRYKAELAYLSGASGSVLFGGRNVNDFFVETWLWNGTTWSQVSVANGAGPAGRIGHCMAASASNVLLFGGKGTNSQFNDTWTFNGTTWTKLAPATSPSVRSEACMAYDSTNSVWVMFGGQNEYNFLPETWVFNGTTWTQVAVPAGTGPSGRIGASMAFDTTTHKTLMFGGVHASTFDSASSATWSFDGAALTWTLL